MALDLWLPYGAPEVTCENLFFQKIISRSFNDLEILTLSRDNYLEIFQ